MDLRKIQVRPLDQAAMDQAKARWDQVAKPLHSLGLLEDAVIRVAGITGQADVRLDKKALVVMCADNGVVKEGVTQTGSEVTAVVTRNLTHGNACVCMMAKQAGVNVFPVDIGVEASMTDLGDCYPLVYRKVLRGTRNMREKPAMTRDEAEMAIHIGIRLVRDLKKQGYEIIATGEMGIGNTTTSSAMASVLLSMDPAQVTGPGSGLSKEGLSRKIQVIRDAVSLHHPDPQDGLDVLAKVGGLDLAGLVGVFIGGAIHGIPVVIDGFISAVAALTAQRIAPGVADYMLASHCSREPAAEHVLEALGLKAPIHGELCLGEGSGAVALMPLLDMALGVYQNMSTFEQIHIESYQPLS